MTAPAEPWPNAAELAACAAREPWPGFNAKLAELERVVVELNVPFGDQVLAVIRGHCGADRVLYYGYLLSAREADPVMRRAFLLLIAAETSGQNITGEA